MLDPLQAPAADPSPAGWCPPPAPHLLEQRVVGAVQVELPKVVAVGKDEEGLFICTGDQEMHQG